MSNHSDISYDLPDNLPTDPILADLLPDFAAQWLNDLTVTWASLNAAKDAEGLRRFGHTIKGSFLQFGFRDMSVAGKNIMQCAESNDWQGAEAYVLALQQAMRQLIIRLQ